MAFLWSAELYRFAWRCNHARRAPSPADDRHSLVARPSAESVAVGFRGGFGGRPGLGFGFPAFRGRFGFGGFGLDLAGAGFGWGLGFGWGPCWGGAWAWDPFCFDSFGAWPSYGYYDYPPPYGYAYPPSVGYDPNYGPGYDPDNPPPPDSPNPYAPIRVRCARAAQSQLGHQREHADRGSTGPRCPW